MDVNERAKAYQTLWLERMTERGMQEQLARMLGEDKGVISRFKSNDLELACRILAQLGLKIVPVEMKCYAPDVMNALFTFAHMQFKKIDSLDQLSSDGM